MGLEAWPTGLEAWPWARGLKTCPRRLRARSRGIEVRPGSFKT